MQLSAAAAVSVHINQMRSAVQSQFKRHFSLLPLLSCRRFKKNIYICMYLYIYMGRGQGAWGDWGCGSDSFITKAHGCFFQLRQLQLPKP